MFQQFGQFQQVQQLQQFQQQQQGALQTTHNLDAVMSQIHKALTSDAPVGTYYQPGAARPDVTATGGVVPTVRRYDILVDKIFVPYKEDGSARVGRDSFLTGSVTEADLIAAGCHIPYLLAAGHIVENGYMRI